jgi:hypothetical protein
VPSGRTERRHLVVHHLEDERWIAFDPDLASHAGLVGSQVRHKTVGEPVLPVAAMGDPVPVAPGVEGLADVLVPLEVREALLEQRVESVRGVGAAGEVSGDRAVHLARADQPERLVEAPQPGYGDGPVRGFRQLLDRRRLLLVRNRFELRGDVPPPLPILVGIAATGELVYGRELRGDPADRVSIGRIEDAPELLLVVRPGERCSARPSSSGRSTTVWPRELTWYHAFSEGRWSRPRDGIIGSSRSEGGLGGGDARHGIRDVRCLSHQLHCMESGGAATGPLSDPPPIFHVIVSA